MNRTLNAWQYTVLGVAAVLMVAVGAFGGWGTYSNVQAQFHRGATAAGVVAAGEGLALVLALTMLCLTMLGQSSPAVVRIGLWIAPVGACATGVTIAETTGEAIVYGLTPMAMSGAAEGLGLIARRVTIYRTGVDAEAQRRNAAAVQQIAYQRAVAQHHPDEEVREAALRESWALAKKVGRGDAQLGADLVEVQRARIRNGADDALGGMYGRPASPKADGPDRSAQAVLRRKFAEMDPVDAVRIARDAHPDMPPAELASLLVLHGVPVDPVQVALVLGEQPDEYEVHRPDAADALQVSALQPLTVEAAVVQAASVLGPDAKAREIAEHVARHRRLVVTENYVRTALSRAAKKPQGEAPAKPMEGGYA
ncbi:conjugal transfer protein [Streptomyces alfalfae]|uniref:Conjugal transfer protein n=1 Tax=Streptomyces alfalfae TaxID=1642299 RepID=A0A7T4TYX6_9ACTN|nr:conjugal transfer protein [Streptomyces alfalfae]QQC89852.1 conjugal transfer protein [Streptomyces alfalfae]